MVKEIHPNTHARGTDGPVCSQGVHFSFTRVSLLPSGLQHSRQQQARLALGSGFVLYCGGSPGRVRGLCWAGWALLGMQSPSAAFPSQPLSLFSVCE